MILRVVKTWDDTVICKKRKKVVMSCECEDFFHVTNFDLSKIHLPGDSINVTQLDPLSLKVTIRF